MFSRPLRRRIVRRFPDRVHPRLSRRDALAYEAKRSVLLAVGIIPILIVAGLIEGTISQIHEPQIPYWLKILFALLVGTGLYAWLLMGGRRRPDGS